MPDPLVTVPLPTIDGREHFLDKAVASYKRTVPNLEIILVRNAPNCGVVWQYGAETGKGDYILMGADDVEMHDGSPQAAIQMIDQGALPAPLIYHTDGRVQACGGSWEQMEPDHAYTEFTRGPVVSRAQWNVIGPMIPTHYYTDNWITYRGLLHDIPTVVCHAFAYTHHMADEGRGAGMTWNERMAADHRLFELYASGEIALPEGDAVWRPADGAWSRLVSAEVTSVSEAGVSDALVSAERFGRGV